MAISIYQINKGINKSIEFKGLKAQYIWYMGGVMVGLIIVFSILYFIGFNQYVCLGIIGITGFVSVTKIFSMSRKYGEHGLMKTMAKRMVPKVVKSGQGVFKKPVKNGGVHYSVESSK
ncbi:DUF4133 domain-containing protein [Sphingobacterium sp. MYb388]|uniref:DUF4133 domain-containing protein n=1 Tax=Sphingobacterium sp. MYb388 TaxID=2745437 RepID=UPI0030A217F5